MAEAQLQLRGSTAGAALISQTAEAAPPSPPARKMQRSRAAPRSIGQIDSQNNAPIHVPVSVAVQTKQSVLVEK